MDSVQQQYEAAPYQAFIHGITHPSRLAAAARLAGAAAPDPRTARVLDVGCGPGLNAIAIAHSSPRGCCVGVDFSAAHIATGKSIAAATSVANVEFRQADLRDFQDTGGGFDYIIAHGVFSWIPDDAKEALVRLCRNSLRPGGVAYISFNTLPGWAPMMAMRKLRQSLLGGNPAGQDAAQRQVIEALAVQWEGQKRYAGWYRAARQLLAASPRDVAHDHFGSVNDPMYLTDFVDYMQQRGMRYLTDATWPLGSSAMVAPAVRQTMSDLKLSPLQCEQLADFAVAQTHRSVLLVRDDAPAGSFDPQQLEGLLLGTYLKPGPPGSGALPAHYIAPDDKGTAEFKDPVLNLFVLSFAAKSPALLPFAGVADAVMARPSALPRSRRELRDAAANLIGSRLMFAAVGEPCISGGRDLPARPAISPLNQYLAHHYRYVINSTCHLYTMTEARARVVAALDGSRTLAEIRQAAATPESDWLPLLQYLWQQGVIHAAGQGA